MRSLHLHELHMVSGSKARFYDSAVYDSDFEYSDFEYNDYDDSEDLDPTAGSIMWGLATYYAQGFGVIGNMMVSSAGYALSSIVSSARHALSSII